MDSYYDGLNIKLFKAIPRNSKNILELGCANGKLGELFKKINPHAIWTGIDINKNAIAEASKKIDNAYHIDIESEHLEKIGKGFDTIVMGDLLEHLKNPEKILCDLYNLSSENSCIICCIPNVSHISVVERFLSGDFSYDENGLLDKTHTRLFSSASVIKNFLDSGWIPDMVDQYQTKIEHNQLLESIIKSKEIMGIPRKTAMNQLGLYQMIFKCKKQNNKEADENFEPFTVIVPTNKQWQCNLNIIKSPGLKEINAEIITITGAKSAAEAYEAGAKKAKHPWRIIAHQDVYFPAGTGYRIANHLKTFSQQNLYEYAIGFAGLDDSNTIPTMSGMVIDRNNLFHYSPSNQACSIDEFAVCLHKDSSVKIDHDLGWHLWGTDLCIQSKIISGNFQTKVIDVPIFHNSMNDYSLPEDFKKSLFQLFQKHPSIKKVDTLCGSFKST